MYITVKNPFGFPSIPLPPKPLAFPPIHPNFFNPADIPPPPPPPRHTGGKGGPASERTVRWRWVPSGGGGALTGTKVGGRKSTPGHERGWGGRAWGQFDPLVADSEAPPRGPWAPPRGRRGRSSCRSPAPCRGRHPPPRPDRQDARKTIASRGQNADSVPAVGKRFKDAATFAICSVRFIWDAGGGGGRP